MKLAKRVGHSLLIKTFAIIQMLSMLISFQMPTYLTFIMTYLVIPSICFAITAYPILGCVYSHYNKEEGKVTGLILGILSFATLLYILIITFVSNPDNVEAELEVKMFINGIGSYRKIDI